MSERTATSPSRLLVAPLSTEKNRFDYYWPRLAKLDVPCPRSRVVPLQSADSGGSLDWETSTIQSVMEAWDTQRAFVRSQYKAAPKRLRKGSHIRERDPAAIDRTVRSLLDQLETTGWEHGGSLVVREWVDLNFCLRARHDQCHPEVRFFIEDGEILGSTPQVDGADFVCDQRYEYLEPVVDSLDGSVPREYARTVAAEFDEDTWTVDFAMDTSGQWYCIEMGLDAVRWDDDIGDWRNHCGHGELEPLSPRDVHAVALRTARSPVR